MTDIRGKRGFSSGVDRADRDQVPFLVRTEYRFGVGEGGELQLGVSDVDMNDNAGQLRVEVNR